MRDGKNANLFYSVTALCGTVAAALLYTYTVAARMLCFFILGFLIGVGVLASELIISHQPSRHTAEPPSCLFFDFLLLVYCLDDSTEA